MNEHQTEVTCKLRFIDYIVDRIEFENNSQFNADSAEIELAISHEVVMKSLDAYVTLHLKIFPDAIINNYPFSFSVSVTGHFQIDADDNDETKPFLNVNAVAILFPYVRALVTTYTANANVPPLILPPMNIAKMLEKNAKELSANSE